MNANSAIERATQDELDRLEIADLRCEIMREVLNIDRPVVIGALLNLARATRLDPLADAQELDRESAAKGFRTQLAIVLDKIECDVVLLAFANAARAAQTLDMAAHSQRRPDNPK